MVRLKDLLMDIIWIYTVRSALEETI